MHGDTKGDVDADELCEGNSGCRIVHQIHIFRHVIAGDEV